MTQIGSNDYTQNYIYLDSHPFQSIPEQNIEILIFQFLSLLDRKKTDGSLYLLRQHESNWLGNYQSCLLTH